MKPLWLLIPLFVLVPSVASADEPSTTVITTLPKGAEPLRNASAEETVVGRARDLLNRAKFLDEAAVADEKVASDLTTRLPAIRTAAKSARERADKAKDPERDALAIKAEELEAELAVSEAEVSMRKRSAIEDRRVARDLRQRAVRMVREAPTDETSLASACDPPFRFTSDGRKIYRIECLR